MITQVQIQTLIDGTYAQLLEVQVQKSVVVTLIHTTTESADTGGQVSLSGEGGSYSVDRLGYLKTLQDQLKGLCDVETALTATLLSQQQLKSAMFPWIVQTVHRL